MLDAKTIQKQLSGMFSADKHSREGAAATIARYLSDDYIDESPENEETSKIVREIVEITKQNLKPEARATFIDMIDVALARVDIKEGIKYYLRDNDGLPLKFTSLLRFQIDFIRYCHKMNKVAILFSPVGGGKTTLLVGLVTYDVGLNVNTLEQIICVTDGVATERGMAVQKVIESPHYKKIFPHVRRADNGRWTQHAIDVQRTEAAPEIKITRDSEGNAIAVNATVTSYGAFTAALGSRSLRSYFDDLATEENSVFNPDEGAKISALLHTQFFSRKKSPIGMDDEDYDDTKNPWRAVVIGTPWAHSDCIYSLRDWGGACVAQIGVNNKIDALNVQIWGLDKQYIQKLKKRYMTGRGVSKDKLRPAKAVMEIPLDRPRKWYKEQYDDALDKKKDFLRPYACEVYAEGDLAYPSFANSVFMSYQDQETKIPILVATEAINTIQNDQEVETGIRAWMVNPPMDYSIKLAFVDLSGAKRMGTVINVAVMTKQFRRRIVEISMGGWSSPEITQQLDKLFTRHKDLLVCFIESVSMQKLYTDIIKEFRDKYSWWMKVGGFDKTTSKKTDQDVGILNLGTVYENGGFEIPNTLRMNHGRCGCGYCKLIEDGTTQTRLTKIESDVLITMWGIHMVMPATVHQPGFVDAHGYDHVKSGLELMNYGGESAINPQVFSEEATRAADKMVKIFNTIEVPNMSPDDGWKSPDDFQWR